MNVPSPKSSVPTPSFPGHGRSVSVVVRFESAWQSASSFDERPRISDYLVTVPEKDRSEALCDLLQIELKYRVAAGESPEPDEYISQFPEAVDVIKSVFVRSSREGDGRPRRSTDADDSDVTGEFRPAAEIPAAPEPASAEFVTPSTLLAGKPAGCRPPKPVKLPIVPGYDVIEILGRGGMGIVYRARHRQLGRDVALKMILPGREFSVGIMERLLNEASLVARFQHPHIVQIFDVGECDGQPYLTLELLGGGSLSRRLEGTTLPALEAAALLEALARAVEYAHQKDVIHRDLKPANILFNTDGVLKITDFGLAKYLNEKDGQTEDGGIMGTPGYMAPEQAFGDNARVGRAADIYALGAILYETLTGRAPFKGPDRWQTIEQVKHQEVTPPRQLAPEVPRDLELICLKCLNKEPRQRFASAQELAEELSRFRQGRPILTRPTPAWERAWKWVKRQPAAASLIAVSVIAILSLILYFEQQARVARRELDEQRRIAQMRDQVQALQFQARDAADRGLLHDAQGYLQAAREIVRVETTLNSYSGALDAIQADVVRQEAAKRERAQADDDYRRFFRLRDEALFHGMVLTGVELPGNVEATRKACREAVGIYVTEGTDAPRFPDALSADQRRRCLDGIYELLLIGAEAEAQTSAGGEPADRAPLQKAIRTLAEASRLRGEQGPTAAFHMRHARYLEQLGDGEAAARESSRAADVRPQGALDHFLIGDAHQRSGRLAEAAAAYAHALHEEPDHFWARYFLAICNLQLSRPAQARDNLTACLASRRDFVWLYLLRGFANGQLNDFAAADRDYRDALALRPSPQATYGLLVNQAILRLRQARALESLAQPWAPLPTNQPAFFLIQGVADAQRQEQLASALRLLKDAERQQPEQSAAYRYQAIVLQALRRVDLAIPQIDLAIEKASRVEPAALRQLHSYKARLHKEHGDPDAALAALKSALAIRPTAEDHVERGRILQAESKLQAAIDAYQSALTLKADNPEVHRWKAEAHLGLRQDKEAARSLDQYFAANGRPAAEVFRLRGMVRARLRQFSGAIADYSQALAVQPDAATYTARGWVYLAYDSVPLALQDFGDAIRTDANFAEAYAGRGLIHARRGLSVPAVVDAEAARRLARPTTARLLWNVAHIYAQLAVEPTANVGSAAVAAARHREQALLILRQAIERLPASERADFWEQYVASDPLLAPIRSSTGYEQLKREFGRSEKNRLSTTAGMPH